MQPLDTPALKALVSGIDAKIRVQNLPEQKKRRQN